MVWHGRMLQPGDEWEHRVGEQLELADIILLLISPSFASSDYCWGVEAKRALERHEQGSAVVVPILVRPAAGWADTPLGRLQALPRDARPIASWDTRDEAYQDIAQALRDLARGSSRKTAHSGPEWRDWHLVLDGVPDDYPPSRAAAIATKLRRAANSMELELVEVLAGSARLSLRSTQEVLNALSRIHAAGELAGMIGAEILEIRPDTGAVLRIESRTVDGEYRSTIHYLPEVFGGRALGDGPPPIVGGIAFPRDDPLKAGFSLLADASHEMPTASGQMELQARLRRYLNTFLVLTGDQVNVTLTPTEDYCGLPEFLRHTELGRDMLAQDVVLKHSTACQLHPSTPHGAAFWDKMNVLTSGLRSFESCFRVWIVPGKASLREEMVGDQGHVTIEKLGLEVLCEEDYKTLRRYRECRRPGAADNYPHLTPWVIQFVSSEHASTPSCR